MYDGTPNEYPIGAMMLFITLTKGTTYTPKEHRHYIFNHNSYIGTEAAVCIGGLNDLNTIITLKTNRTITIHMLLKSVPATQGMGKSQLF